MEEGHESIVEQFYKRRRDLILLSALIIFINTVAGKIEKINFVGTELKLARPDLLPWVLALVLGYFLLRYIQYVHMVPDKGFINRFNLRRKQFFMGWLTKKEHKAKDSELRKKYPNFKDIKVNRFFMYQENMKHNEAFAEWAGKDEGPVLSRNPIVPTRLDLFIANLVGTLYLTFRTPLVTDYVFPVFFAWFAFATFWPGFPKLLTHLA